MFREPRKRKVSRGVWKTIRILIFLLLCVPLGVVIFHIPNDLPYQRGTLYVDLSWGFMLALCGYGVRRISGEMTDSLLGPLDPEPATGGRAGE